MTNSDKVKNYVSVHKTPVQESMPEFIQRWMTAQGPVYWHSSTCKRSRSNSKRMIVRTPRKDDFRHTYVHFIPEYDMLEISLVAIDNRGRHKDGEVFRWEYCSERLFIIKDDPHPYNALGEEYCPESFGHYYNRDFVELLKWRNKTFRHESESPLYAAIMKFCGHKLNLAYFADHYYKHMGRTNALPKISDDIAGKVIDCIGAMQSIGNHSYACKNGLNMALYEKINETYAVVRCINVRSTDIYALSMKYEEMFRIYINKHRAKIYRNELGLWYEWKGEFPVFDICNPSDFLQCREVGYVYETAAALNNGSDILGSVCRLINHPLIERFYKAGYRNIAKRLFSNSYSTCFKEMFGKTGYEKSSIFKATGCSKHMLRIIDSNITRFNRIGNALRLFRELFGEGFMHFTQDKILRYIDILVHLAMFSDDYECDWKSILPGSETIDGCRKFIEKLVRIIRKGHYGVIRVLYDISNLYSLMQLNYDSAVADMLHSERDIVNLHDRMTQQYSDVRKEQEDIYAHSLQKSLNKLQNKRRELYCYEDDNYQIRISERADEIMREGDLLHHCVGSYTDMHVRGLTNILFLRRKESPETPFYTIEIQNNKVVQIHGFANRWLGCSPEAIPFVYAWIQKIGASCDRHILLSRSTGYCCNGAMLDESYLYNKRPVEGLTA